MIWSIMETEEVGSHEFLQNQKIVTDGLSHDLWAWN